MVNATWSLEEDTGAPECMETGTGFAPLTLNQTFLPERKNRRRSEELSSAPVHAKGGQ
jgi:hypothetical protein